MGIDKDHYTSHIRDSDKAIKMRRVLDKIEIVLNSHRVENTDFLDPYEIRLSKSILNRFDQVSYMERGGYDNSERKTISIFPDYYNIYDLKEPITCIKVEGDLGMLSHKDYLGALLNLGIKRDKIGDILVHNDFGYIIVKEEIGDFILFNLEKIGNKNIKSKYVSCDELEIPETKYREIKSFLTSLRLDLVISSAYNISRKDSMDIFDKGLVKVNWEPINKATKDLKEGDVVSVRGYGRFILYSIDGLSKKGRFMSNIRIII